MFFKIFKKKKDYIRRIPSYDFESILDAIENEEQGIDISIIFWGLLSEKRAVRIQCTKLIQSIILDTSSMELIKLDKQFRSRTSLNWSYDWKYENANRLLSDSIDIDSRIAIMGLSSFHPNGYFREKAIRELIKIDDAKIVPFLILRLNDWVNEIQELVSDFFANYIQKGNVKDILQNLEIFYHTTQYQRMKSDDFINRIKSIIDREVVTDLIGDINLFPIKSRIILYSIVIEKEIFTNRELIDLFLKDKSNEVRFNVFHSIHRYISEKVFTEYKDIFLNDNSYKIRVDTIIEMNKREMFNSQGELLFGLLDRFSSVREISRYYLRKLGFDSFSDYYIGVLKTNGSNHIAMLGLTEVASTDNFESMISQLSSSRVIVVKKTLRALSTIDFERSIIYLIDSLKETRIGITNESKRILIENKSLFDTDKIYEIYNNSLDFIVKRNAALVLFKSTKWLAISYIFEGLNDDNEDIAHIASNSLLSWKAKFNNSFTKPSESQYSRMIDSYNNNRNQLSKNDILWFEKMIDDFKYR